MQSLRSSNRHRLLRRGRAYGDPSHPGERGIHFICLNANIARQFEFVQHTWLNNPKFAGLYEDTDPLVATHQDVDGRTFTVQAHPFRQRVTGLPTEAIGRFFATGMLLNVIASMGLETLEEPWAARLVEGVKQK